SALRRFIQTGTMGASEPPAAISAPQVRMSAMASPLEDARDLLDRAAAEIGGDDDAGPGRHIARQDVSFAQPEYLVPEDDFAEIDADDVGHERARQRRPPPALLRNDDRGRLLARLERGFDFLVWQLHGECVFVV